MLTLFLVATLACHGKPPAEAPPATENGNAAHGRSSVEDPPALTEGTQPALGATRAASIWRPPWAGEEVAIAAGTLLVGSRPGVAGRNARTEADLVPMTLASFHIDRLPYPNDPAQPPRTSVSRDEAEALCQAAGKRLCDELEWERACRGDTMNDWPGGESFDSELCSLEPSACDSPLGVSMLGVLNAEWTSSRPTAALGSDERTAVLRGAEAEADKAAHRCGARSATSPTSTDRTIGFRCCRGEAPKLDYPDVGFTSRFRLRPVTGDEARAILSKIPELEEYATDFRPFRADEIDEALAAGGQTRQSLNGWEIAEGLLRWSPRPGDEAWVLVGRGAGSSLLAVLYPLGNGEVVHGASFVLKNETAPIALAFTPPSRNQLLWSSCWGCAGDDGSVILREDGTLLVAHH